MPKVQKLKAKSKPTTDLESAWPDEEGIKINIYGRSGTGKTTLAATFPGPILWLVCSGGRKPGELRSIDTPEYRKKITPVLLKEPEGLEKALKIAPDYASIVLDHASGLQDMMLRDILGVDELPTQKGWGLASQQQWGQCSLKTKESLRALLSLSGNVVIVAQEREFNTDSEAASDLLMPYVASALSPSVVGWLNPAVDYIVETFIRPKMVEKSLKIGNKEKVSKVRGKGVEYGLRVGPHDVFTTKFRIPKGSSLPEVIVDPDYSKLIDLIQGAK